MWSPLMDSGRVYSTVLLLLDPLRKRPTQSCCATTQYTPQSFHEAIHNAHVHTYIHRRAHPHEPIDQPTGTIGPPHEVFPLHTPMPPIISSA